MTREMTTPLARRTFFTTAAGAALALAGCKKDGPPNEGTVPLPAPGVVASSMPRRPLGKTGITVSMVGLGGFHLGIPKEDAEATRIIHSAIDRGIDFMDNCWDYHEGKSEERMGKALADGHRAKVFLMTKLDGRTKAKANQHIDQSLERLRTDHIDLVQIHEVIRMDDPKRVFEAGGAIEALVEARKAGKIRFIGFTGHKDPAIHMTMLAAADAHGFTFDTVQMPINVLDAHYKSFEKIVLPKLVQKNIGVLAMKALGSGKILATKAVTAVECLRYAMSLPTSVVITGCESIGVLDQAIKTALEFKPLSAEEITTMLAKTKDLAANGKYETFKTTDEHDSTSKHPEWLA